MELLKKEMERVGLNNHNPNHHHDHHESPNGDHQEMENDQKAGAGKKNNGKKKNNHEQKTTLRTPADIYEHPSFYSFILDMPGLDAINIKVKVENGILQVTGKKKEQQMGETATESSNTVVKVIRAERRRARYMRKFTLPADASHEDVKATYKDGVLYITVAKRPPLLEQSLPNTPTTICIS